MATIAIPAAGIKLVGLRPSKDAAFKDQAHTTHAIQLSLDQDTLAQMVRAVHKKGDQGTYCQGKAGKPNTITIGGTVYPFVPAKPASWSLLCRKSSSKNEIHGIAPFAQCLEMKKTKNVVEDDEHLKILQHSLALAEQKKKENTTTFVKDGSNLPPAKSGKKHTPKTSSISFLKGHRAGLFDRHNEITRSVPASPSLGALSNKLVAPDGKSLKAKALRFALVHLLAVRPVSERFICSSLKCLPQDLTPDLKKLMKPSRLDPSKNELADRGYKELDVWTFQYKSQEDRQDAIDHAVKAYDRLRISTQDNIWQLLLPKEDRGKGIILSKLSLHHGPLNYARTPRINVEGAEQDNAADNVDNATGTDSDNRQGRLAPGSTESNARSASQDPIKKTRVSEREAQAKRLFTKNPNRKAQTAKPKESKPAVKDPKKTPGAESAKVKSTEFVHDSDEDERMEDIVPTGASAPKSINASQPSKVPNTKPAEKRLPSAATQTTRKNKEPEHKRATKTQESSSQKSPAVASVSPKSSNSGSGRGSSDVCQGSIGMARTVSHKRSTSSPIKPSPLRTPPANASDFDNDKAIPNGPSSSLTPITASPQLNRSRNSSQLSLPDNSGVVLKRKASDMGSDIHDHGGGTWTNGYHAAKRHHADDTPPISDPPSDSSGGMSPDVSQETMEKATRFRKLYERYFKFHYELTEQSSPRQEDVEKLIKMKNRLEELKAEIYQAVGC